MGAQASYLFTPRKSGSSSFVSRHELHSNDNASKSGVTVGVGSFKGESGRGWQWAGI